MKVHDKRPCFGLLFNGLPPKVPIAEVAEEWHIGKIPLFFRENPFAANGDVAIFAT